MARSRSQSDVTSKRRRTSSRSDNRDVIADISDVLPAQQSAQHGLDILAQVCTSQLHLHGGSETTSKDDHTYCGAEEAQPVPTQTFHKPLTQHALSTDGQCFYYTGVPTVILFHFLFSWIMPFAAKFTLRRSDDKFSYQSLRRSGRRRVLLSLMDEFLLTLIRIRQGFDVIHLSYLFGVSPSHVSKTFNTWVFILYNAFNPLFIWPSQALVRNNLPASFKAYPRTRVVIDCTEFYVQKPFRPLAQRATWSHYKHANTFKLLVGIMPSGAFTFLSDLYSGSTSDIDIVKKSGFIDKIEEGDDVMADRGFNIRHLLLPRKATLNIPAFTRGKQLSKKAGSHSRRIAAVRIHVKRAIRRL